jgi:hypothetical protein
MNENVIKFTAKKNFFRGPDKNCPQAAIWRVLIYIVHNSSIHIWHAYL